MRGIGLAIAMLAQTSAIWAATPIVAGNVTRPECADAAILADTMFESRSPRLHAPLWVPQRMRSRLILGAADEDISGGDALQAGDAFAKLPQANKRKVYWSRDLDGGKRIVVVETAVGWRGDMYSLYLLDGALEQTAFLNMLEVPAADSSPTPVLSNAWRPPLVFELADAGGKWFIDVGQPFQILAIWSVYSTEAIRPICTISFHNPSEVPGKRLPKAVQMLADRLDEALGPGLDEGTLHPTASLRLAVQHVLANAAYRPWALADDDAYNSRREVDAGLREWAQVNRARARLRADILKTYPEAEHSLVAYYASTFGLSPQNAEAMAKWVLDVIFRSHFTFSTGGDVRHDRSRTNPWPPGALKTREPPAIHEVPTSRFPPSSRASTGSAH